MDYKDVLMIAAKGNAKKAHTFGTGVGVALYLSDGRIFNGFNVETHAQNGYHAEEVALLNAMVYGRIGKDIKAIAIYPYPPCLSCLYYMWEFTHGELEVITQGDDGLETNTLVDLLPYGYDTYPDAEHRERKLRVNG